MESHPNRYSSFAVVLFCTRTSDGRVLFDGMTQLAKAIGELRHPSYNNLSSTVEELYAAARGPREFPRTLEEAIVAVIAIRSASLPASERQLYIERLRISTRDARRSRGLRPGRQPGS